MASNRLTSLTVALLAAGALALGACGDDDSKSSSKSNDITRPQYIAKVDAICKEVARKSKPSFAKLQALIDASGTYKSRLIKAAPTLRTVYKLQASKLERFKAIEPPTADTRQVAEIRKTAEQTIDEFREFLPAAERGDLETFIDVATDATGSRAHVDRLGTTYGFRKDCFSLPLELSQIQ
jgi:hypothetical protein